MQRKKSLPLGEASMEFFCFFNRKRVKKAHIAKKNQADDYPQLSIGPATPALRHPSISAPPSVRRL